MPFPILRPLVVTLILLAPGCMSTSATFAADFTVPFAGVRLFVREWATTGDTSRLAFYAVSPFDLLPSLAMDVVYLPLVGMILLLERALSP
jgi:hypothetical protein